MYILDTYTFTQGPNQTGVIETPGVYGADEFAKISNVHRNHILYNTTDVLNQGQIEVSDDGSVTTVILFPVVGVDFTPDELTILMYDKAPGSGPGPSTNVAVTNWPTSQNVNGTVSISGEVEVKNDTGSPLPVSGTVSVSNFPATQTVDGSVTVSGTVDVGNFPATQPVSGSVSVSNFPATQTVDGSVTVSGTVDVGNYPATQTVDGTVDVGNFPTTFDVGNFPATQTVDGTVDVGNFPATQTVDGTVDVGNFPATYPVTGTFWQTTQPVSGSVSVSNFPATQTVDGTVDVGNFPATQPVSGSVTVNNFPATQAVTGTFWQTTQPVSGSVSVSNFPATQPVSGTVTANQGTSPWVVSGTTTSTVSSFPTTSTDAFGRLRVSQPYTMFDSQHRYADNNLWATSTATGGAAVFNPAQGLMDLSVTTASGSQVLRETVRTFAYQPGKSLQVMTTFVMSPPKTGLSQRIGYFNVGNGFFVELNDNLASLCFVERSGVSGSVTNTRVSQSGGVYGAGDTGWNVDKMDGTGPSGITLDITKAQILWMDIEWLGVGTVRMGFVINGQFYICHDWNHANLITSTYITTASLPMRSEIINNTATASSSTFKQICATVISEGGYVLTGAQKSVGTPILTPRTLTVAGFAYPVVSIRLKADRLDAICIMSALSIMGNGNNEKFRWSLEQDDAVVGGSWLSVGADSAVEYNLSATSTTGGRTLASGYISSSNQGSPTVNIFKADLFQFQLERNPFTLTPYSMTLTLAGATSATGYSSVDWEEVCR